MSPLCKRPPSVHGMTETKADIRKRILAKRGAVSTEWRQMASRDIARHALIHAANGPGGPVAGYWPYKTEADPRPLMEMIRRYGRPLALPVIVHPDVIFRRWIEGVELVDAGFGTLGPDPTSDEVTPAVLLVPLAAFDARCNRIGWGQGHYDRVIARLTEQGGEVLTIGIAFSFQQVDHVPTEPHDRPLDLVVTEQAVFTRS
jgi:5-formyltetrahydrofolate cyclo-ligase